MTVYSAIFIEAEENLRKRGFKPLLRQGSPISETEILAVDEITNLPMPAELRRFYIEMGDGFEFVPHDAVDCHLAGWQPAWLSDYAIHNTGFYNQIEEELSREIACGLPQVDRLLLHAEAEKRKQWIPFYGFTGGGDLLCLDSEGKVRFYQALEWTTSPDLCRGFLLANSFTDFVSRWSEYSFVVPGSCSSWTSFCWSRSGVFDWSPSHFQ